MRRKLFAVFVLLAAVGLLTAPEGGFGEQPGRSAPQKKKGGGPGGGWDPKAMFDRLAKGRDHFLISETGPMQQTMADYANAKGITDGKMTLERYLAYTEYRRSQGGGMFGGKGPTPGSFGGKSFGGKSGMIPGGNSGAIPEAPAMDFNQRVDYEFKKKDVNGDNVLNRDEMGGNLRDDLIKWDRDRDFLINFDEFKAYYLARELERQERDEKRALMQGGGIDDDWDKRPVVYRFGKLPPNIPKWFAELDKDEDGQVSLAEWRRANKEVDEFAAYDRNQDGLLTPSEVIRQEALAKAGATGNESASAIQNIVDGARIEVGGSGKKGKGPPGGEGFKKRKS